MNSRLNLSGRSIGTIAVLSVAAILFVVSPLFLFSSATANALFGEKFTQEVKLNPTAGLPGSVTVHVEDSSIEKVRMSLVVDDELMIIVLRATGESEFSGNFPSPRSQIRYSYHFDRGESSTKRTKEFVAKQTCATEKAVPGPVGSKSYLIFRAQELETEAQQLMYLGQVVDGMKQQP